MEIQVVRHGLAVKGILIVFVTEETQAALPNDAGFSGKAGRMRAGADCLLVGLGKAADLDLDGFRSAVGAAIRAAGAQEMASLIVQDEQLAGLGLDADLIAELALAARLTVHAFTKFKSEQAEPDCPLILTLVSDDPDAPERVNQALAVAQGVCLARDLVNTPANVATPAYLAETARQLGADHGFQVDILDPDQAIALGMGAFASVFQGSHVPARFVVLDSRPGSTEQPLVFVGKGITFDTGGISLKPAAKMHEMKGDMAGAAAILGLFKTLGLASGNVRRVVGLLPCTENVPGNRATKPGDVITALNGKTVEILNTDAEGRLILADALTYSARFDPEIVVDLATLTGACLVALGTKVAAVFATAPELETRIRDCGAQAGERFWPMPLWKEYAAPLKSDIADLKNIAAREGGAIYAALFLKHFAPEGVPWAHLDIAGPAWTDENASIFRPGGTGFGVRTLWNLLAAYAPGMPVSA